MRSKGTSQRHWFYNPLQIQEKLYKYLLYQYKFWKAKWYKKQKLQGSNFAFHLLVFQYKVGEPKLVMQVFVSYVMQGPLKQHNIVFHHVKRWKGSRKKLSFFKRKLVSLQDLNLGNHFLFGNYLLQGTMKTMRKLDGMQGTNVAFHQKPHFIIKIPKFFYYKFWSKKTHFGQAKKNFQSF